MPLSTKLDKRNEDIKIYINGEFFHRDQAKISVFDSGFLLGDGIWEGIRLVNNSWLFLDEHLDRLYEGCKAIDIRLDEDKKFEFDVWYSPKNNLILKVTYNKMGNWEYRLRSFE